MIRKCTEEETQILANVLWQTVELLTEFCVFSSLALSETTSLRPLASGCVIGFWPKEHE